MWYIWCSPLKDYLNSYRKLAWVGFEPTTTEFRSDTTIDWAIRPWVQLALRVLKSHKKQNGENIYGIIKAMCPPGYHHDGFVATHALGHMNIHHVMCGAQVHELPQSHCGDNREGILFWWLHICITKYGKITNYLLLWVSCSRIHQVNNFSYAVVLQINFHWIN